MGKFGKCFACGKAMRSWGTMVDTKEDQAPYVGPECAKKIKRAGPKGYQPPLGGPRLYVLSGYRLKYFEGRLSQ